jgi:hypothetical protein
MSDSFPRIVPSMVQIVENVVGGLKTLTIRQKTAA